jgi:hypothetical protein
MTRTFTTATDDSLINLIQGARSRLCPNCPSRRMTVLVGSIFRWQDVLSLVIEYATEITAINPAAARFAPMEMFDFVSVWICIFCNVFAARNLHSSLFSFRSPGVLSSTSCSQMPSLEEDSAI